MEQTAFSERYKGFLGLLAIFTVISLVVMNDFTTILETEEAFNVLHVQKQLEGTATTQVAPFPNTSQFIIYKLFDFSPFWTRLSNVIVFLLLILGIRIWMGKLFGKLQTITYIITVVSSFLLISMAKFAVADIPLAAFHMMSMAFAVICLKQPKRKWQIVYGLFVMGSFLVQPTSGVIYGVGLLAYLMIFHKDGARLRTPIILGVWLGLGTLFFLLGGFSWPTAGFLFSYQTSWGDYFMWQFIGILPWLGFLPAALWDLFQKLRKKEEMAIILFGWLLFSIISHGLILQLCLLFLISKQVENYFKPNYPYKSVVKSFAIINLVCTFFLLVGVMFGGFAALHSTGYRSAAVFSGIYWVFGFIAILGLFSDSRKFIIGGIGIGGAFSLLLFWVQLNPILNKYRDLSQQVLEGMDKKQSLRVSQDLLEKQQFQVYGNGLELDYSLFQNKEKGVDCYILNEADYQRLLQVGTPTSSVDTIRGRLNIFEKPNSWYIVRDSIAD